MEYSYLWRLNFLLAVPPVLVAFAVTMGIAPAIIKALRRHKVGQTIQKDGPESHHSKAGTPTMGGIIIVIGLLAGVVFFILAYAHRCSPLVWFPMAQQAVALLSLVLGYFLVGLVDDYLTIKPIKGVRGIASKPKSVIQLLLAAGFVLWLRQTGFDPTLYLGNRPILHGEAYWILATLFIAGMANFVNITDGLDGLVPGLTAIACAGFVESYFRSSYLRSSEFHSVYAFSAEAVVPIMLACIGACLAFLWFNTNPAKVFMGDTGSLAIGALLPAAAILMHMEILMMVIGLVFILDGFSTIIQWAVFKYTRITTGTGKRVFLKSPVHHHFEMKGIPEQTVVVRFWICGIIAAVLGFAGMSLGWW